jgi:hypothetical protein
MATGSRKRRLLLAHYTKRKPIFPPSLLILLSSENGSFISRTVYCSVGDPHPDLDPDQSWIPNTGHPDLYQTDRDPQQLVYCITVCTKCTCTEYGYVAASSYSAKLHPVQEDFFISYSDSNVCFFPSRLLINISVSL